MIFEIDSSARTIFGSGPHGLHRLPLDTQASRLSAQGETTRERRLLHQPLGVRIVPQPHHTTAVVLHAAAPVADAETLRAPVQLGLRIELQASLNRPTALKQARTGIRSYTERQTISLPQSSKQI